jgi:hypothetical protein
MKITIEGCSRCGEKHTKLNFKRFKNRGVFGWWAICPSTKEPVLMDNFKDADKAERYKRKLYDLERRRP